MTTNQKAGWTVLGILLLVIAVLALPSIYYAFHWKIRLSLDDPNPAVRVAAIRATGSGGHIGLLTKALRDDDADVRLVAAMYLKRRKEEAAPSVNALIAALKDKHAGVRRQAAEALSAIGAPAVPALVKALSDLDPYIRAGAALGLSDVAHPKSFRKRSTEEKALVVPALEELLKDPDSEIRRNAQEALNDLQEGV